MKQFSETIIKKYGTRDVYKIARKIGLVIVPEPLGELEGYISMNVIHVNSDLPTWYQKFTIACQIYDVLTGVRNFGFILHKNLDFSNEKIRFGLRLITDFERLNTEGFDNVARCDGIPEKDIKALKENFYKILEGDE